MSKALHEGDEWGEVLIGEYGTLEAFGELCVDSALVGGIGGECDDEHVGVGCVEHIPVYDSSFVVLAMVCEERRCEATNILRSLLCRREMSEEPVALTTYKD